MSSIHLQLTRKPEGIIIQTEGEICQQSLEEVNPRQRNSDDIIERC